MLYILPGHVLALLEIGPDMLVVALLTCLHMRTELGFVFSSALYTKQFSKQKKSSKRFKIHISSKKYMSTQK